MNLFAHALDAVLSHHGHTMTRLYGLRDGAGNPAITPAKVSRLQRALTDDVTAILNEREIAILAAALQFEPIEVRRLCAALTGEAVRQLLAGRVSGMSALQEGERIVDLLIEEEEDVESLRTELARSGPVFTSELAAPTADRNARVTDALDAAAEACELGELWLSMAIATHDRDRQEDLLGTAWTALDRAAQLLAVAPTVAQGSPSQSEWRRTVETALANARQMRRLG